MRRCGTSTTYTHIHTYVYTHLVINIITACDVLNYSLFSPSNAGIFLFHVYISDTFYLVNWNFPSPDTQATKLTHVSKRLLDRNFLSDPNLAQISNK